MNRFFFALSRKITVSLIVVAVVGTLCTFNHFYRSTSSTFNQRAEQPELVKASKKVRAEYMFNMVKSPHTQSIPPAIRHRELKHAANLRAEISFLPKTNQATFFWFEAGPEDVGGRTRALALDLTDSNRLIAGGVSGGLWESTDRGLSWSPLLLDGGNLSVSYIAQDPRDGQTNTWYYSSGEFSGNSASDPGRIAPYYGSGVYKSTDNGRTWSLLPAANPDNLTRFDSPFDFVNRIAISPTTGTLFLASNAIGIYRSTDGGLSFGPQLQNFDFPGPVLGGVNDHDWADVAVNEDGVVLAVVSSIGSNDIPATSPGVYVSNDDGVNWIDITPFSFPNTHGRSVVAFAPSNPDIAYIFTTTLSQVRGREDVRLHRINVTTGNAENLSSNLPALSEAGNIETQGGYNMALAVKPDDENFVVLGGTNVYRSRDGFSTLNSDRLDYWVGGYDAVDDDFGSYENHHPDQHVFFFDPNNTNALWNGNDGGVYLTTNIGQLNSVVWSDRNRGYNVTQFYTVNVPAEGLDSRIAGGTQDNGTPFLRLDDLAGGSRNISVGDGTHLHFGEEFMYVGFQNGSTLRLTYNLDGTPTFSGFSFIQPASASNQLFVTPFVVDPNDEDIMYYPAGGALWRNNELTTLRGGQSDGDGSDDGWTRLTNIPSVGIRTISAMAISRQPANILYYGASDTRRENASVPQIYRLDAANTSTGSNATSIPLPSPTNGSYVSDIAVNPSDADEILVVLSNYDIIGLYHSTNGGLSYTAVEGNLQGTPAVPGPSLRAATLLPLDNETQYFVGTSTGLYSTTNLNGASTSWVPEGETTIGQAVVWDVTSRTSDDLVAVATHGRGLFVGSQDASFAPTPSTENFILAQNYPNPFATTTVIPFDVPVRSRVSISVFDLSGREIANILSDSDRETGRYEVEFNAASLASGVYVYRMEAIPLDATELATFSDSRKLMVIQ